MLVKKGFSLRRLRGLDWRGQAGEYRVERYIDEVLGERGVANEQPQVERAIKDVEDRVGIEIGTDFAVFGTCQLVLAPE